MLHILGTSEQLLKYYVKPQKPCYKVWYLAADHITTVVVAVVIATVIEYKYVDGKIGGNFPLGIAEVPFQLSSPKLGVRTIINK